MRTLTLIRPYVCTIVFGIDFAILQGDQIGRIFAHWVIVYFGQFD
jgi:hypothetical protein